MWGGYAATSSSWKNRATTNPDAWCTKKKKTETSTERQGKTPQTVHEISSLLVTDMKGAEGTWAPGLGKTR